MIWILYSCLVIFSGISQCGIMVKFYLTSIENAALLILACKDLKQRESKYFLKQLKIMSLDMRVWVNFSCRILQLVSETEMKEKS